MKRFLFWAGLTLGGIVLALVIYALEIPLKVLRWYQGD